VLTANSAQFISRDLPDRSLYVALRKPADDRPGWRERAQRYVEANRLAIVSDIIGMLESHRPFGIPTRTRFREFEERILQPCCGTAEAAERVISHIAGARADSNVEEDQARAIIDVFEHELSVLDIAAGAPAFIRSEIVNAWGRRALNESQGPEFKGRPIQLIRNLAKAGFLPQVDREWTRLERDGRRERHSGVSWRTTHATCELWLVTRDGAGDVTCKWV
jgi:hypothetical protein